MARNSNHEAPKSKTSKRRSPDEITFEWICETFEERYGRGWKRRVAEAAGVPESNVHSWIKAGKMPPWILSIFRLLIQNVYLRREKEFVVGRIENFLECDQVVEAEDGFAVYRFNDGVGKSVARAIPDIETAREYASLPRLKMLASKAAIFLSELREDEVIPSDPPDGYYASETDNLLKLMNQWNRPVALRLGEAEITDLDAVVEDITKALEELPKEVASKTPDKTGK